MGSSACGISTTSFIHSPPIQLEEIQNRQLPEPPIQQDTDLYCQIESDSAIDINSSNTIQHDLLGSLRSTEEVTDNYGYLKPTFNRFLSWSYMKIRQIAMRQNYDSSKNQRVESPHLANS